MKNPTRSLASFLAFLIAAFTPGLAPYEAVAQVVGGSARAGATGVSVVPQTGIGAVFAPLSPAALTPGLSGSLTPSLLAPSIAAPSIVTPGVAAALIPALPAPAIGLAPAQAAQARAIASAAVPAAASAETGARGEVVPAATPVQAREQLALAGTRLEAASADSEKTGLLESFFTGARKAFGTLTGSNAATGAVAAASRDAAVPQALTPVAAVASAPEKASVPTPIALEGRGLQPGEKFLAASAADKSAVPAPAAAPQDPSIGPKAVKWMMIQDAISMSVFIMTSIAYPMVVIPAVGGVTYGVLMALGPLAAIALGPLSGMIATRYGPREGLAVLSALRAVLTVALPVMALTGMISFWPLLIASIANGWQFSLLMTSRSAYTRRFAVTDPKRSTEWMHIGNLTAIGFSVYFVLQVVLGSIGQIGGLIDAMDPMMPFWISAAVNVGLIFLNLFKIPKIDNLVSASANAVKKAAEPLLKRALDFGRKFWKEIALLGASVAVYGWGLPLALPLIGTGLGSPLWIAGALMFWISRTDTFKNVMATPKIRNALLLSALAAGLIYPFQNLALPLIAATLGAKALIYGQLLGALFFGQLISNASMARLPQIKVFGRSMGAERLLQAGVLALGAIWVGARLFPGNFLAAAAAVAIGAGLISVTSRLTNRGWIKFYGIGLLSALGVALSWGFYPGIFASVMLLGLFVGPFVSAINAYISTNSDPKTVSQTFGVSSSLFNAMTSFGYGAMAATVAAQGNPASAFPGALTPIIAVYLLAGIAFFFAPRFLPGLPEKSFRSAEPKAEEPKKPAA
ncbi:MAG: hypothetical protein M0D55_16260 [Elusimicrobiota bacterium]|nr:MAG: hypothetical protein M0D55_16260 [Elusimicrobiota bacterium]